jgi:hypothetical protein
MAQQPGSLAPPQVPGAQSDWSAAGPQQQEDSDSGVVKPLGIDKDEINRRFGHDPKEEARQADAKRVLASLDEQDKPESERAIGEASKLIPDIGKQQEQRKKERDAQEAYHGELSRMRSSKQQHEQRASEMGDAWLKRQEGRNQRSVLKQQLGAAPTEFPVSMETQTPPSATRSARAEQGTMPPPGKRGKPVRKSFELTSGSAPRDETPAIPDYQDLYFQPPNDERKRQEEEADALRRRAQADRNTGLFGFHGTGQLNPEPILLYVPMKNPMPQGPTLSMRKPIVTPKELIDRERAGAARSAKGTVISDVPTDTPQRTDAGRVPRSPDRRDDASASQDKRPSAKMTKKRRRGRVRKER